MNDHTLPRIILRPGKEKSLQRRHPWVFSGAIARKDKDLRDGDIVEVYDARRQYLATGHFQPTTIAVRVFSFEQRDIDRDFWREKLVNAIAFRKSILLPNPQTNMYRLVNGEGDGMPGLIIDAYNRHLVMQVHSMGMYRLHETLAELLAELLPDTKAICLKTAIETTEGEEVAMESGWIYGQPDGEVIASEHGILFKIDILNGQKTGFFLDQRESRAMVGELAKGHTVLNMFSYSGGFSLYALRGGAEHVDSVDISQKAIDLVEENVRLMGGDFAKRHNRNINRKTMEKIRPGGLLFTFSCSQAISRDDFQTLVFSAAALAGKNVRVVSRLQHAPCHPVSIYHPEGEYLKGLLLEINNE